MPQLAFLPHAVLFAGPLGSIAPHTHAAPALVVGTAAPFEMQGAHGPAQTGWAHWVPPGLRHTLNPGGQETAVCYFEPGSAMALHVRRRWPARKLQVLDDDGVDVRPRWVEWAQRTAAASTRADALAAWAQVQALCVPPEVVGMPAPADTRVQEVMRSMKARPGPCFDGAEGGDTRHAQTLAAAVALSPSRLRHVFTPEAGTPWRRYRVWCRLLEASRRAMQGQALTDAALDAGFSDASHFTRSFKDMFGIAPSLIQRMPRLGVHDLLPARP